MNIIKNAKTGKTVKNAITRKPMMFESAEHARHFADTMEIESVSRATAWNSIRKTQYVVCAA